MKVCRLILTDGRGTLKRMLASAQEMIPAVAHTVIVDDSEHELGFAGAIQEGWSRIPEGIDFVLHLEDDFVFKAPVPLTQMAAALEMVPNLAQVALKRQPWNDEEVEAGGIVELNPFDYAERVVKGRHWASTITEHRRCFTTNPSLYPIEIARKGWPQTKNSEGVFTHQLLEEGWHFAYWGEMYAPPTVEHIGAARAGHGY